MSGRILGACRRFNTKTAHIDLPLGGGGAGNMVLAALARINIEIQPDLVYPKGLVRYISTLWRGFIYSNFILIRVQAVLTYTMCLDCETCGLGLLKHCQYKLMEEVTMKWVRIVRHTD